MPSMTSFSWPSSLSGLDRSIPHSMNFQTGQGGRAPVHKRFASCMDSTFSHARSKSENMTGFSKDQSFAQWSNSSPLLTSNGDTFDLVPQAALSIFPRLSPYDDGPNGLEDPLDLTLFSSWPYEGSYFCDAPRFPRMDTVTSPKPVLPSIPNPTSIADLNNFSSPSSMDNFSNVFDFDFATSLPIEAANGLLLPPTPSPRSSISAPSSCSSSPSHRSMDVFETMSLKSRETSPTHSESDHHQRRRFPCLISGCSRRFTSQYTLKVHVEAHKPKPRTSFPCTHGCSERFSRQHDRLRHEVAKHGKVCEFLCDDCGRFFSTKKTLGNHKCPVAQGGTRWVNS